MKEDNKQTGKSLQDVDKRDLQDSPRDEERLQPDEAIIDLPDVKDIPGQEFIHPPALGELADTTISSDDEEGTGLLDEQSSESEIKNNNSYKLNKEEETNDDNSTLGIP